MKRGSAINTLYSFTRICFRRQWVIDSKQQSVDNINGVEFLTLNSDLGCLIPQGNAHLQKVTF